MSDKFGSAPPAYPQQAYGGNAPPQGAASEYFSGQQQGYPPQQQGYYPPQQGYPQQGMYYGTPQQQGPPQQGYYVQDRKNDMGTGICAGIMGALACCCCLDILF